MGVLPATGNEIMMGSVAKAFGLNGNAARGTYAVELVDGANSIGGYVSQPTGKSMKFSFKVGGMTTPYNYLA